MLGAVRSPPPSSLAYHRRELLKLRKPPPIVEPHKIAPLLGWHLEGREPHLERHQLVDGRLELLGRSICGRVVGEQAKNVAHIVAIIASLRLVLGLQKIVARGQNLKPLIEVDFVMRIVAPTIRRIICAMRRLSPARADYKRLFCFAPRL